MTTMANGVLAASTRRLRLGPSHRIALLTTVLTVTAVALFAIVVRPLSPTPAVLPLPWVAWAVAFALTETLVVHVQWQREAHTFSMGDLVMPPGCSSPHRPTWSWRTSSAPPRRSSSTGASAV